MKGLSFARRSQRQLGLVLMPALIFCLTVLLTSGRSNMQADVRTRSTTDSIGVVIRKSALAIRNLAAGILGISSPARVESSRSQIGSGALHRYCFGGESGS